MYFTPWLHIANYIQQGVDKANYTIVLKKWFISEMYPDGSIDPAIGLFNVPLLTLLDI